MAAILFRGGGGWVNTAEAETYLSHLNGMFAVSCICLPFIPPVPPHVRKSNYRKTYFTRRALIGNKVVDHSNVVGASPVGAAPTTSSFST